MISMRLVSAVVTLLVTVTSCVQASEVGKRAATSPIANSAEDDYSSSEGAKSKRSLAEKSGCYTNLTEVHVMEQSVDDTSVLRTYTLCPNTVFYLGSVGGNGEVSGGDYPIMPRANTWYKCGDSGASTNNCTLTTGDVGLLFEDFQPLINSTIQGLTFTSLNFYGVYFSGGGKGVAFVDCIFRDMSNSGPIVLSLTRVRSRLLDSTTASNRALDSVNRTEVLEISFSRCVFNSNSLFEYLPGLPSFPGVITGVTYVGNRIYLDVRNSLFSNNTYLSEGNGYAIQVDDALNLESNCFIDNQFVKFGPVQVNTTRPEINFTSANNYVSTNNGDNLTCSYAILTNDPLGTSYHCVAAEAASCALSAQTPAAAAAPASKKTSRKAPSLPKKSKSVSKNGSSRAPSVKGGKNKPAGKYTGKNS